MTHNQLSDILPVLNITDPSVRTFIEDLIQVKSMTTKERKSMIFIRFSRGIFSDIVVLRIN